MVTQGRLWKHHSKRGKNCLRSFMTIARWELFCVEDDCSEGLLTIPLDSDFDDDIDLNWESSGP